MPSASDIKYLITQGENAAVEFKSAQVKPDALAKEIVALSNTSGGVILVGVEDDGTLSGATGRNEEWVSNIAGNNIIPAVNLQTAAIIVEGHTVLYIEVPKGKDKPYQTNQNQFLIRVGSTNRTATQQELMRLFQQGGVFHFDLTGVERTSASVLNMTRVDQYFQRFGFRFDAESPSQQTTLLQNADILQEDGRLTVAGTLCFAINPGRYLPQSSVSFAHFKEVELSGPLTDRQVMTGTLDILIDTAVAVLKNNLPAPSDITGTKRIEAPALPDIVLRELVANAVAHRDYSIAGSDIRIFLFPNRLEFRSPGRLPNTLNLDKIRLGASYARNPVIVSLLQQMGYMDKLGRGLPMVIREIRNLGKTLEFQELGEEFVVTIGLKNG